MVHYSVLVVFEFFENFYFRNRKYDQHLKYYGLYDIDSKTGHNILLLN